MAKSFDRVAEIYDDTRKYPIDAMAQILRNLEKVLDKDALILDAGVGTGRFAKPLQSLGYKVVGVDVSDRMMDKARQKRTENLVKADLCQLPFKDLAFKTTLSVHVLHLISTWRCALGEIARVTQDSLVSVAFQKEDSPVEDLRKFYDDACEQLGFPLRHPGVRERELAELLKPDFETVIALHEHLVDVKELISEYDARAFSNQWDVPEEIHLQAMEALRQRYEGIENLIGKERISVISWKSGRLRELAKG